MRRWLSLASPLVLLLCFRGVIAEHRELEPCPPSNVCLIFVEWTPCTTGDREFGAEESKGYVWDATTKCRDEHYGSLRARIEIQPLNSKKWKVAVVLLEDEQNYKLADVGINFGADKADFLFIDETQMKFTWGKDSFSMRPMKLEETFKSEDLLDSYTFKRYSFEIEAENEPLWPLFSNEVKFMVSRQEKGTMTDSRFMEKLGEFCNIVDVTEVCYNTCGKISVLNTTLHCPARFWYHRLADDGWTRRWKPINKLHCKEGKWVAEWEGGMNWINHDVELQCSEMEPSKNTPALMGLIGGLVGGLVLLSAAVAGGFFFHLWWKKRNAKKASKEVLGVKVRNLRDQWAWPEENENNTAARTPGGSSRKVEEFTAKTDFEGIKTEIIDKETTVGRETTGGPTNIDGLVTEQGLQGTGADSGPARTPPTLTGPATPPPPPPTAGMGSPPGPIHPRKGRTADVY